MTFDANATYLTTTLKQRSRRRGRKVLNIALLLLLFIMQMDRLPQIKRANLSRHAKWHRWDGYAIEEEEAMSAMPLVWSGE